MARLDFLWQLQARDEKLDMEALQVAKPHRILAMILAMILAKPHRILLTPSFAELQQEDPLQPASGPCGHTLPR